MAVQENDATSKEKEALLKEVLGQTFKPQDEPEETTREETVVEKPVEESVEKPVQEIQNEKEDDMDIQEPVVMKVSTPMPKYGRGGIFIPIAAGATLLGIVLGHINPITRGIPSSAWFRYLYITFGVVFLFFGIKLIIDSNGVSAISENVRLGKLVTTGPYARTRNPQYAGILLICTALLFFSGNAFMYIIPIGLYIFLTKLMQNTEEIILTLRFGQEYQDYCNRTYRIIPIKKR